MVRDNGSVSQPENSAEQTPEPVAPPAVAAPPADETAAPAPKIERYETTVRRAPKLGVFLVVGAVLGAIVTLILTSLFPADPAYGFAASYGYFLIYGVPFGVVVGGIIGLILDRRSKRSVRTVTVEHESVDEGQ